MFVDEIFFASHSDAREEKLRESNRTPIVSAIRLREIFCQFRNFRSSRPSSSDLCVLTSCVVSIPEEIRESNPAALQYVPRHLRSCRMKEWQTNGVW